MFKKYAYYAMVLLFVILRRLVFPLIALAVPIRAWLRSVVYNYHLQNNIVLKRLYERSPTKVVNGWSLTNLHGPSSGIVKTIKYAKLKYIVALPLWLLLDDDCNQDTYDSGFNRTIVTEQRKKWMPNTIKVALFGAMEKAKECTLVGNTFDLGDIRATEPLSEFWSIFWWTLRNPAYNFNYKFNQLTDDKLAFKVVIKGRLFGWKDSGKLMVNGSLINTYSWEFGKKV
jgi:hypothetical protein